MTKRETFKLDKQDKIMIVIFLITQFIIGFFLENGSEVVFLIFSMFIFNKYLGNTKKSNAYKDYDFLDEESYNIGLRRFLIIANIYVVLRSISVLLSKYNGFTIAEVILLVLLFQFYEGYLSRKYVRGIKGVNINIEKNFINNKKLVAVLLVVFICITVGFFNSVYKSEGKDHIKFFNYEYKLTYGNDDKRVVEVQLSSYYMKVDENDKNAKYLDNYIIQSKKLVSIQIFKCYSYIGMVMMLLLVLSQIKSSKYKEINYTSTMQSVFLIGFLIFSMIAFNGSSIELENDLSTYFHEYLSGY